MIRARLASMPFLPAVVGLAVAAAPAPEPGAEWSAPSGCPDRAQVLEQARALVGDAAADHVLQAVAIRGAIEAAPAGFVLDIDIETPSGVTRKRASAGDCTVLGSVAALMVAVAVDPVRTTSALEIGPAPADEGASPGPRRVPEPAPTPDSAEPQGTLPERVARRRAEPPPARTASSVSARMRNQRRTPRGLVRASGSIGSGLVPELDVGLAAGAGVLTTGLRAELVVVHVLARDARYPPPSPVGASVAAWGGSVRVGPRVAFGAFDVHLLAGLGVAALSATGFGVRNTRTRADTWAALALIPGVRWQPHPRVALGADLEAEVALRRPAFFVDELPIVYRTPRLGVRATAVVEIRWGGRDG